MREERHKILTQFARSTNLPLTLEDLGGDPSGTV